jgi:ectoine hydroxylase-related dioxygenase (phytanoyl-CoA dioxygenase family)
MRITAEHLEKWERDGYVVVEGFLTAEELAAALDNMLCYFPTWDELRRHRHRYRHLLDSAVAGVREFPFCRFALNDINTHPEVISFVERALGTTDVHCQTGQIWAKYAGAANYDQSLHVDFLNNSLVYPRDDGPWRQILMMLYLTDVTGDLGPTYVVSRRYTDRSYDYLRPPVRPRQDYPELYEREVPVTVRAGSLLIYSMKTWHRGSAIRASEGYRFTHQFVYRHAGDEWMGWRAWPRHANDPMMKRWISRATPRQREVLGFPRPGHPYWTSETLEGVARRYPKMDMTPYLEAARRAVGCSG